MEKDYAMKDLERQKESTKQKIEQIISPSGALQENAYKTLIELLAEAVEEGNKLVEGFCHAQLARYYYSMSDLKKSGKHLRKGLPLQQANKDYDDLAISYNLLGIDAMNHGDYQIALDNFLQAINDADMTSRPVGTSLINIGHIYLELGDFDEAINYCSRGRQIYQQFGPSYNLLIAYSQESMYHCLNGHPELATPLIDEMIDIAKQLDLTEQLDRLPFISEVYALYYHSMGEPEQAHEHIRAFIRSLKESDETLDYIEDMVWMAQILLENEDLSLIPDLLDIMQAPAEASNINHLKLHYIELQIRYHDALGELVTAAQWGKRFFDVSMAKKKDDIEIYRMNIELRNKVEDMKRHQRAIEEENRRLLQEASTDPLTGIANRTLLNQKSEEMFQQAFAMETTFGMEMLDIDFFKEFNDTYGHQMGDEIIQTVAGIIDSVSDDKTFVARYGGDEFMIVYLDQTDEQITNKANSIRRKLIAMHIENSGSTVSPFVTISQGIRNSLVTETHRVWDYTFTADHALYEVKRTHKGSIRLLHGMNATIDASNAGICG